MLVTAVRGGHAVGVMPACTAQHERLHVITGPDLPELPPINIALKIRDQATPALRELALSAISALNHANIEP